MGFQQIIQSLLDTLRDVVPIVAIVVFFQAVVLRRRVANLPHLVLGFVFVILGLALFMVGLRVALFPLGESMASQLASAEFLGAELDAGIDWRDFGWTYVFAFCIGFSAAVAEPSLIAVAIKAHEVSGGAIGIWGLRVAVALGVGSGVALGTLRIVLGLPLPYLILTGYLLVVVQTYFAPRKIIPLAYDAGGVSTSTVTVPIVAALGLGLARDLPGRDPYADGFGLIACAVLFPMITVMGYAQLAHWWTTRRSRRSSTPAS